MYVAVGHAAVPFLEHNVTLGHKCNGFFLMSVYLQREPVHRNDTEMVPVILFTEKNCLHIIHKSFYEAAFVVFSFFFFATDGVLIFVTAICFMSFFR